VGVAQINFPKSAPDPTWLLQRGTTRINVSLSPKGGYTRHNGPDGANLSFADYPPLGFCCVGGSRREFCTYSLPMLSR
jgi:hypothetical protein